MNLRVILKQIINNIKASDIATLQENLIDYIAAWIVSCQEDFEF